MGLAVHGGYVPAGASAGVLTIASAAASPGMSDLVLVKLEGRALDEPRLSPRRGTHRLVLSRDGNVAASTMMLDSLALATTSPEPFALQVPAKLELVHGYPAAVKVAITRSMALKAPPVIEITGIQAAIQPPVKPPPGALTFKPGSAAATANDATLTVVAPANAPEGRSVDLVIQGKAKIDNKDRIVASSAIAVTVVRPFTVELATAKLALSPGQTAVVKGKIQRQAIFKEAAQLKLDGLPKGVTLAAPLKAVAADQDTFQVELRADAKAPPVTANLSLTASTTIAGMAYAHPAVSLAVELK
jgi:hypothetical protein